MGLPVVAIDRATGENERLMRTDMMNDMAEMLEATGQGRARTTTLVPRHGHPRNGARMGRDPKTSVLNAHSQCGPHNVFADGSGMVSSGCQNPSLTYMALTAARRRLPRRAQARQSVTSGGTDGRPQAM